MNLTRLQPLFLVIAMSACTTMTQSPPPGPISYTALARPDNYWNDTGIDVQDGQIYRIQVTGGHWDSNPYWTSELGAGSSRYTSAASGYLLPGAPEGALIGRVGQGPVFLIGNAASTPAHSAGRLKVSVNDEPAGFGDNSGSLVLDIRKQ